MGGTVCISTAPAAQRTNAAITVTMQAALKMARRRCAGLVPPTLLQVFEQVVQEHISKHGRSAASGSDTTSGSASSFSVNKMLLQNPAAAGAVGKAMGEQPRTMTRLTLQFHRNLSASLAETTAKSVQKLRRHAQRVVAAEVRSPPHAWLEQMANHCTTVSRYALDIHPSPLPRIALVLGPLCPSRVGGCC